MKFKFIWVCFILFSFNAIADGGAGQCRNLFAIKSFETSYEFNAVLAMIKTIDTDRRTIFQSHRNKTVAQFLDDNLSRQEQQLHMMKMANFRNVPPSITTYYLNSLEITVLHSRENLARVKEEYNLNKITILDIISKKEYEKLYSVIDSFIFPTNAVLSEFIVALSYGNIIHTEATLPEILINSWSTVLPALQSSMYSTALDALLNKRMDLHAYRDGREHFVEVKYMGTSKIYNSASGSGVFTKLVGVKRAIDSLPYPAQVTLAIVGPGRLSATSEQSYKDAGIEVVYLTPNW